MIFAHLWPHRQQKNVNPLDVGSDRSVIHYVVEECGLLDVDCLDLIEIGRFLRLVEVVVNGEQELQTLLVIWF